MIKRMISCTPLNAVVESPALVARLELLMWNIFEEHGAVAGTMTVDYYKCTAVSRLLCPCIIEEAHWHYIGEADCQS